MYADDARISVSVATIEFANSGAGTALTWTEQGAYLDGVDGAQAPALRIAGTTELLDSLPGTRLFDDVPKDYALDLVSSIAKSNGILELQYRRHR